MMFNIVSCNGYVQEYNITVILKCRKKLVSYYLSKGFVVQEQHSLAMKTLHIGFKQHTHTVDMNKNYSEMTFNKEVFSVANTPRKLIFSFTIFNELTSIYYDDKNDGFGLLLIQYTEYYVNNIDHQVLGQVWKENMYKAAYESNIHKTLQ